MKSIKTFVSLLLMFILICPAAQALDSVSLKLGSIQGSTWQAQGIAIALDEISKNPQQLALTIDKLQLATPLSDFSLINIRCTAFTWHGEELNCQHGNATLHSSRWQTRAANFSFKLQKNHIALSLTDLAYLGGVAHIDAEAQNDDWSLQITMNAANGDELLALFPSKLFVLKTGKVNFHLYASGKQTQIEKFRLNTELTKLTGQISTGKFATEKLDLNTEITAQNINGLWQWQTQSQLNSGGLYVDPLYLKADGENIRLNAEGTLTTNDQHIIVQTINFQHSPTVTLNGNAELNYKQGINLEQAKFNLRSDNLQKLSTIYIKPFVEQAWLDGVTLAGQLNADLAMTGLLLTSLSANFKQLTIKDNAKCIQLFGGIGTINWSDKQAFNQSSSLAWQQLQINALPFGATKLSFLTHAKNFQLLGETHLPFLEGDITIKQFKLQTSDKNNTAIYFQGDMKNVSLQQLSAALKWQPLAGKISGHVPQVTYSNNTLKLDGELLINVFGGTVKIAKLAASNLLKGVSTFYADVEIDQLDLEQLTSKYQFGSITGKLSGFIKQLQIENWHPVHFLAWLGTPENDDSQHLISQKAVNSIAQIGGSGTSDLLSRTILKLFNTFQYDRIGIGCSLNDGVCQLSGLEATALNYTIVKGGGLPRIEVMGFNSRVDWTVLIERLARISDSDKVIIQ
jgi:hypothetical protein